VRGSSLRIGKRARAHVSPTLRRAKRKRRRLARRASGGGSPRVCFRAHPPYRQLTLTWNGPHVSVALDHVDLDRRLVPGPALRRRREVRHRVSSLFFCLLFLLRRKQWRRSALLLGCVVVARRERKSDRLVVLKQRGRARSRTEKKWRAQRGTMRDGAFCPGACGGERGTPRREKAFGRGVTKQQHEPRRLLARSREHPGTH
jgi:hypothetical protein